MIALEGSAGCKARMGRELYRRRPVCCTAILLATLLGWVTEPCAALVARPTAASVWGRSSRACSSSSLTMKVQHRRVDGGNKGGGGGGEDLEWEAKAGDGILSRHTISWYPGHIAKAERTLEECLKKVDVVIEVRDARIPQSTTHPLVPKWVGSRNLIVVFNRVDVTPNCALEDWKDFYSRSGGMALTGRGGNVPVYFVDSRRGKGIHQVKRAALRAGAAVNERRERRGILPRSVRCAVIGYPNVGKSALINQLIGKRVAKSRNIPGVTKKINWVRLSSQDCPVEQQLELLDSPGIIPCRHNDPTAALKLAICNDIGEASYDRQVVAGEMIDVLVETGIRWPGYVDFNRITERLGVDPRRHTGEEFLHIVGRKFYHGSLDSAADKLLGDFRRGYFGGVALEGPSAELATEAADRSDELTKMKTRRRSEGVDPNATPIGKAAMDARQFVGKGDFEGW
jgi:ribosome biogenesis GTPase A